MRACHSSEKALSRVRRRPAFKSQPSTSRGQVGRGSAYLEDRIALQHLASVMFSSLKRQWRELRNGHPGNRFRAQFERSKGAKAGKSFLRRWSTVFVASVLLIVGVFLCFIPGPGIPFIILGAGLLAEQFRVVATALDWLEVKLRKMTRRGMAWWSQASLPDRGAAAVLLAIGIAGVGYGAFHVIIRG